MLAKTGFQPRNLDLLRLEFLLRLPPDKRIQKAVCRLPRDESFTLYLLGEKPPRGRKPVREHTPKRRKDAERLIIGGDRKYAEWTRTNDLRSRSKTFFRRHDPCDAPLKASSRTLDDMNTIRNAIAHTSTHSQESFKRLVRNFFGTYPPNLTVGKFPATSVPSTSPPQTFMQYYLNSVVNTANLIVPH